MLLRTDYKEDENRDKVLVPTGPQDIDYHTIKQADITAVTCCRTSNVVFYATIKGLVSAYDFIGEPQATLTYCGSKRAHLSEPAATGLVVSQPG